MFLLIVQTNMETRMVKKVNIMKRSIRRVPAKK